MIIVSFNDCLSLNLDQSHCSKNTTNAAERLTLCSLGNLRGRFCRNWQIKSTEEEYIPRLCFRRSSQAWWDGTVWNAWKSWILSRYRKWQIAHQSVLGVATDWASSGCNLCLPFLSHLKAEVSGSDRVMYKSSTWLVTAAAFYQPPSLPARKNLHRKRQYLMWNEWEGYSALNCRATSRHECNSPLNSD